jgi:hypothetical protein
MRYLRSGEVVDFFQPGRKVGKARGLHSVAKKSRSKSFRIDSSENRIVSFLDGGGKVFNRTERVVDDGVAVDRRTQVRLPKTSKFRDNQFYS